MEAEKIHEGGVRVIEEGLRGYGENGSKEERKIMC